MAPLQPTNQEILREIRYEREHYHRFFRDVFCYRRSLVLSRNYSLPQIALDQIQESCNKATAIYWTPKHDVPYRSLPTPPPQRNIINSVYDQWFRGHDVDIEFGHFVVKLIAIMTPLGEQGATIQDILTIHRAWCDIVATTLPTFFDPEVQRKNYARAYSSVCFNKKQHMHYKLQPLFRALIIIYDHSTSYGAEPIVHLVRTGDTAGLSAPISFENTTPVVDTVSGPSSKVHGDNTITTTLSSATSFVMDLELREEKAFTPDEPRDLSVLDEMLGSKEDRDELARKLGYTGAEIQGPSTNWIKLAEGEEMAPPLTTSMQVARIDAGLDPGQSPVILCRQKRENKGPSTSKRFGLIL